LQKAKHRTAVRSPRVCIANLRVEEFLKREPSTVASLLDDGGQGQLCDANRLCRAKNDVGFPN
jgi:hypothetical protein